jgi:hypothetical protein
MPNVSISNSEFETTADLDVGRWMFDVGCWMLF